MTHVPGVPVVFEDDTLIVVDKPAGLLSQPGRVEPDSVHTRVAQACSDARGPMLVHRLDMDTSGLLILAKTRTAHRVLQQQFEKRQIGKRYCAVLESPPRAHRGRIQIPLRLDIDNRPRQIVCHEFGKHATTIWRRRPGCSANTITLYPLTGRTHQLRVHMADHQGLGVPIIGDRLYGGAQHIESSDRLMLHAEMIAFNHPDTGIRQTLYSVAPFQI